MAVRALSGGDKLARALAEIAARVKSSATLNVGFLEGATYPDGTSVPMVAALNEFGKTVNTAEGSYYQLPRPYFRSMIAAKSSGWGRSLGNCLRRSNYDVDTALKLMGEGIKGQLQQSIADFSSPPLADSTVARKGFNKPLVESGHMMNSVDYEVKE